MGIVAGLAQGAKVGGPFLIPITGVSIILGAAKHSRELPDMMTTIVKRALFTLVMAFTVFILTTPYAVLGTYYFVTWRAMAAVFTGQSPIYPAAFWDWLSGAVSAVGVPLLAASGAGVAAHFITRRGRGDLIPLAFTVLLALSIFLWYALFQKFWVQIQYLVVAFAIAALLGGSLVDHLICLLPPRLRASPVMGIVSLCVLAGWILRNPDRIDSALGQAFENFTWRDATTFQVGNWLSRNKPAPPSGTVLFDIQAYFDPADFPHQYHNGGPIHWTDLARVRPDYFMLTIYGGGHWMAKKISEQRSSVWDSDYYNMRLYQDLLGTNPDVPTAKSDYSFITPLAAFRPGGEEARCVPRIKSFTWANLDCFANALLPGGRGIGARGPTVWLFKLDVGGLMEALPIEQLHLFARGFSSSSLDTSPDNALRADGSVWRSAKTGDAAVGEFIGAAFGRPISPKHLTVKWVAPGWLPSSIEVEYADAEMGWQSAGSFAVMPPADPSKAARGAGRWEEGFALPAVGTHRLWRVKATAVPPANTFGLESFRFE